MSVRVAHVSRATLSPRKNVLGQSLQDILTCNSAKRPVQIGHDRGDERATVTVVLPSGPLQGKTLYISMNPNSPTHLTTDEIAPFKFALGCEGKLVPSPTDLAPDYLFEVQRIALNHYTLVATRMANVSSRGNGLHRSTSRPMERVQPEHAVLSNTPLLITHMASRNSPTVFASGPMDTSALPAQHKVRLYPRIDLVDPKDLTPLATLVYDHPGNDVSMLALYFETTIDGRVHNVDARVGWSVGEFYKIKQEIDRDLRTRSIFWRMFFAIYNTLDTTYEVERQQKQALTAVLNTYYH